MSRARLLRRVLVGGAALLVVVIVVGTVLAVSTVRRSFPQTSGRLSLPGLSADVTVIRDAQGVPRIYADTAADLFAAQGFVAAQDRFFEMDLRRHITAGRLSELVGSGGLETDKVIRTLGWRRVAEQELPTLATATRSYLESYAAGVNAYIQQAGSPDAMSLEYAVLSRQVPGYEVEPWSALDSLTWLKAMAWDLRGNFDDELARARLAGSVSARRIAQLFPPYPVDSRPPILSAEEWVPTSRAARPAASALPAALTSKAAVAAYEQAAKALAAVPATVGRGEGIGSNSWVLAGSRTSTGKPLLANDPHLGVQIPGIWHQAGLHCRTVGPSCPFDVSGFSFAGLPGIVVGHNQRIAWGVTNLAPDVSDFYLEQVSAQQYLRDGEFIPFSFRSETIKVAGEADVSITVRSTVHGPLLSDVIDDLARAGESAPVEGRAETGQYAVSLAWTGLVPGKTMDSLFAINRATGFQEFRDAARLFAVPAQNLVYADVDGHIGYQAPGLVPVRGSADPGDPPGYWPAPGWKSEYDWKGYVSFDAMPYVLDPDDGIIVAANQSVSGGRGPFLTSEWDPGFRAERIRTLLTSGAKVTPQRMAQIQLDTRNEFAPTLVDLLLDVDLSDDPFTQEAQGLLDGWDFAQPVGQSKSAAASAYFNAVWRNLLALTFDDEMPPGMDSDGGSRWMQAVAGLIDNPRDAWWDNRLTSNVTEDMTEVLRQSLVNARLDLTKELGKNPGIWQWGRLHTLTLAHPVLGGPDVPGLVARLFNRGPVELPGGSSIVNANSWHAGQGFEVTRAPSMRMVVDLGDLDASRWVNQTGVSGHAFADHYDDQIAAWAAGETFPWPSTPAAVAEASREELTLTPAPPE